jgi:hypothetical protein
MEPQDQSFDPAGETSGEPRKSSKPEGKKSPVLKIALFAVLALMIGALIVDQQARHASQAAFDALNTALGDEKKMNQPTVTRDEVHRLVGREPDDDGNPDDATEQFTWQGVPYKHIVYVGYYPGKVKYMKDVYKKNTLE